MNLCIIIPAYNEAARIEKTVREYAAFFSAQNTIRTTLLVILNGCIDESSAILERLVQEIGTMVRFIRVARKGKGNALKVGFDIALGEGFDLIGFVDADMATRPFYFFDLIRNIGTADGIIASRYMPNSQIYPSRPLIKRWGSRLIYETLIKWLLGINYYDYQCGAKVFTKKLLSTIIDDLHITDWACDIELLYLAKQYHYTITEHPTVWYDQTGSKMTIKAGLWMLVSIFIIWARHRTKKPHSS